MSSLGKHWRVLQKEMEQRPWLAIISKGWAVIAASVGLTLAVVWYPVYYILSKLFSPGAAKVISILFVVSCFLALMLRFWETYHDRFASELRAEWRRVEIVDALQDIRGYGAKLIDQCREHA